ncbi:MAG: hypothetical protein ACTH2Q_09910 [Propionibacteriaceae bacterium]
MTGGDADRPTRAVRWALWLAFGVVTGIGLGFLLGLARPRIRGE